MSVTPSRSLPAVLAPGEQFQLDVTVTDWNSVTYPSEIATISVYSDDPNPSNVPFAVTVVSHPQSCTKPIVSTQPATNIGQSTVTLNGIANPNGCTTTAWFQWGTNTSYGNETSHQDIGSGSNSVSFSQGLNELQPGQIYHYRAAAQNGGGVSYGDERI